MKKLILMMLLVVGGVMTASAADDIYLRTDFRGDDNWGSDIALNKFTFVETNASNEDVYTFTINSTEIKTENIWFRLHINGWGAQICPYTTNGSYTFQFANGQNETYGAKYDKTYFQGSEFSFGIPHSTIKASQYKITLFRGNNEVYYENENCKVMWIKVDIVYMPITVSDLGYATFSCNRALDLSSVTAYYAPNTQNGKVVLQRVDGKVPAGTGLLIAGSGLHNMRVVPTDEATALETNLLKASVESKEITPESGTGDYYYFLAGTKADDLGFYYLNPDGTTYTSGAGKAYLQVSTPLANETNSSRASWIFLDDETTGIDAMQNVQNSNIIYDLQGRVAKTGKAGLYIKNGKKYFVK